MTEISFARSFLSALDMRPTKLDGSHVSDPREYPAQAAYIMPKLHNQPAKRKRSELEGTPSSAPGSESALTVTLKNLKSAETVTLQRQPLSTSIFDVKTSYAKETNGQVDKIRLLYNKKPVPDSKTLKDVLGTATEKEALFTVMVMGGGGVTSTPAVGKTGDTEMADAPVAQGTSGKEVLEGADFWKDLNGFLLARIRDEAEAEKLTVLFQKAWKSSR